MAMLYARKPGEWDYVKVLSFEALMRESSRFDFDLDSWGIGFVWTSPQTRKAKVTLKGDGHRVINSGHYLVRSTATGKVKIVDSSEIDETYERVEV